MAIKNRIIFRADGNSQIGLGHVIRSLALANMLNSDFECLVAIQEPSPALISQIQEVCAGIIALPETQDYLEEAYSFATTKLNAEDIVVLDGYYFETAYQEEIKKHCYRLVCLDDIYAFPFVADVIINQAGGITPEYYKAKPKTKYCFGPAYALLREPFLKAAEQKRQIRPVSRIFINMGGADPENHTLNIVQDLLAQNLNLHLEVVTGGAYQHLSELQSLQVKNGQLHLHQQLSAKEICLLMQQCDAAIIPPSSVSYEWCSVGGLLFLNQIADNQTNIGSFLKTAGLAFDYAEFHSIINHSELLDLINNQVAQQKKYFDGRSGNSLRSIFLQLGYEEKLLLRKAKNEDALIIFDWINDPAVRANSFNPEPIPLEVHKIWFLNKLIDANCVILIAEVNEQKAGMVRYDIWENRATISYLLQPDFRGKGLGSLILEKGTIYLQQNYPLVRSLVGHVQQENVASVNSFYKAGFKVSHSITPAKPGALVFEKLLN